MKAWYVARTNPRQEGGANVFVRALGHETLLPFIIVRVLNHGRLVPRREVMFPGYLFVCCAMTLAVWADLKRTPGVWDVLRNVERTYPHAVADDVIDGIRLASEYRSEPANDDYSFERGEPLHITSGPYAGLSAFYDSSSDVRVNALTTLFNRQTMISLPVGAVERVRA